MTTPDQPAVPKPDAKPAEKPVKPVRTRSEKWRRRFFVFVTTLVLIGLAFRVLLHALFPTVLDRVARTYGLHAEYDKLDLSVLGADVGIWGLRFTPVEGGKPVLTSSYCRGAISTWALLKLQLHVQRAEAEDAEVFVERLPDGTLPLVQRLLGSTSNAPQPTAAATSSKPASLDAPLTIDALRLQSARVRLRDAMMSPVTDVTLDLDLLVKDVGANDRPTHVELQLNSPETLAALYVTAEGASRNNQISADLSVKMVGLNLLPAKQYLEPFGIVPQSQDISATAKGKLKASLVAASTSATRPTTLPAGTLQASLALDDIVLSADAIEAAGMRSLRVDAREVSPGAIRIDRVELAGIRANLKRTEKGLFAFAGIELGQSTSGATTQPAKSSVPKPTTPASAMPIVEVDRFELSDVNLAFVDRAFTPANEMSFHLPQLLVERFSTDPAKAKQPAKLTLSADAPGLAKSIRVDGDIAAAAQVKTATFKIAVTGITANAAGAYLRPLGVDESFNDGSLACTIDGQFEARADGSSHASLNVADVKLADAGKDLIAMSKVSVRDASFDPAKNNVRFDDIELVGPTMPIARDADGTIRLLGLHTIAKPATKIAAPTTQPLAASRQSTPTTGASPLAGLPSVEIGKLTWHGSQISLDDHAAGATPTSLVLDDITAGIDSLHFGPGGDGKPGTLTFAMHTPGLVESVDVKGTLAPTADALTFDVGGDLTGITLERVRSLLNELNFDPAMQSGTLHAEAMGSLRGDAGVLRAEISRVTATLSDGDTKWLSLNNAVVRGASFDGQRAKVEAITVDAPAALMRRDEAGRITVAGIKLLPPKPAPPVTTIAPPTPTRVDLSLPIVGQLDSLTVKDASLRLQDDAVLPAADVLAVVQATLSNLVVGENSAPAAFGVNLTSPGVIDQLAIAGSAKLAPHEISLIASIKGTGLSGKAIESYLPPTIGVDAAGRSVQANVSLSLQDDPRGGSNGAFELKDAKIANGDAIDDGVTSVRAKIDRIDLPDKVIAIDELAVEGAQFDASQDAAGVHALGVTISPTPLRASKPAAPTSEPIAGETASDVSQLVRASNEIMPLISVKTLSLGADRLAFHSASLAEPLVIECAKLTNAGEPMMIGGATPTDLPPIHLQAEAGVVSLVKSIKADAHLSAFAEEPNASTSLEISGIDGTGLTMLLPALRESLEGKDLADARFTTSADARFKFARRGALGIDLTRDITSDFAIKDTKLTVPGSDRPLIGVQEVRGDKIRVSPATGTVIVGSLDIGKPIASVIREKDGVHVAGLTLKVLQPTTAPATAPATSEVQVAKVEAALAASAPVDAAKPASGNGGEVRIDRLTMSGLDFLIEDRVNEPHSVLPITDLDVEVVGLSTRALSEAKPVRFSAVVTAGKVPLPPRKLKVGVETEDRDVFAEASANGNLTLYPKPSGYVRGSISGLELTAVRGLASEYGITLGGGTFDGRLDVRMKNADTFEAKVWPTFNELRMKEAPNGPIQSTFQLPAPPDVLISTIEDADGSITFPLTVPIDAGKVDTGAIIGSAIGSVGKVLTEAMVAAPLKAGKLMGGLVGLDMTSDRVKGLAPVTIDFAPGESQLTPEQIRSLEVIRDQMRKDPTIELTLQHELGGDDVALADDRVNLGLDDSKAISEQLLSRKFDLQRRYADLSAALVVTMATQDSAKVSAAQAQLRETATQLKVTEDGLDSVFDLLRPGADRQASRRAKAASILLADLRLRSVQDWLLAAKIKDANDRVRRSNALYNPLESGPGHVRIVLNRRAKS